MLNKLFSEITAEEFRKSGQPVINLKYTKT